ncbi:MAG TPA: YidC/Oxa1 family insertase periplasmic-domain containing protein, partial [Opitutales bacterium]|nr:YidC/Oxa1 family insertase periplasmic-domain containing protein [Opitutales bacterium]
SGLPGAGANMPYRLISQSDTEVVYGVQAAGGLEITRHYSIELESGTRDPGAYTVHHETYFRNRGEQSLLLNEFGLHLGTATPTGGQTIGIQHLNFNYYDGKSFKYLTPSKFAGGGFMSWIGLSSGEPKDFIAQSLPLEWASVKNQFFASIFTPETDAKGFIARPVDLPRVEGEKPQEGITGEIVFDLRGVEAGSEQVLAGDFYAGPKEYRRLEAMGKSQDRVMQFGWPIIGFISKLLLSMMVAIAGFLPNYGIAIIVVTVLIKAVLWPLTAQAARSSRRMAKIQEPMKALREEFKDDPKRMQMETMKLFKEHQVNPVGGCLPMLVQIPIFFGLFRMIMSASELRFAEFLWVQDLSAPDTVGHLFGLPINILPFFMGASMFYQMRMMPMAMDNTQQKIFRFMPFIFFVFCYSFSSGLVLYWTVQNLLTILQHYLMRRKEDTVPVTASGSGTPQTPVQASPYLKKGKGRAAKSRKKQG